MSKQTEAELLAELLRLVSFNKDLMDEMAEQCRINGMSAEREERLKSKTAVAEHTIQQLVTALEGSGTKMRSDQWYIEIEAVAAGKHYLNNRSNT